MLEYVDCNICGSSEYKIINICIITKEDAEIAQKVLNLVKCKNCGLVFVNPQPLLSAQQLEQLYSKEYFDKGYMRFYGEETDNAIQSNEPFSYRLSLIEKYKDKGRFLDIGCATGGFLSLAKKRGWEVFGVEISDYACEVAVKKNNLNVFKGYLEEAHFKENFFDVVCASDILEHVNEPTTFLKEIHRILRSDGLLYLAIPNADSLYYRFFHIVARCNHRNYFVLPHHLYHFSPSTIRLLLNKVGFKVKKLMFSHSRSKSLFMDIFNFHDRILIIVQKRSKTD